MKLVIVIDKTIKNEKPRARSKIFVNVNEIEKTNIKKIGICFTVFRIRP